MRSPSGIVGNGLSPCRSPRRLQKVDPLPSLDGNRELDTGSRTARRWRHDTDVLFHSGQASRRAKSHDVLLVWLGNVSWRARWEKSRMAMRGMDGLRLVLFE
jgi:hypothetical protein